MIDYLRQLRDLSKHGLYSLLLNEGTNFTKISKSLPDGVEEGEAKMCFQNAYRLAMNNPKYTYVEGFARGLIPVQHAWCITEDGTVIDPTWHAMGMGKEYFGIPLRLDWVVRVMLITEVYGIFPLLIDMSGRLIIRGKRKKDLDLDRAELWIHPDWIKHANNPV